MRIGLFAPFLSPAATPELIGEYGRRAETMGCDSIWIGEHVVIMSGVDIGEMSIIGANSVVTKSIPPRSIAVGAPAKVIRKWDDSKGGWVPVDGPSD